MLILLVARAKLAIDLFLAPLVCSFCVFLSIQAVGGGACHGDISSKNPAR